MPTRQLNWISTDPIMYWLWRTVGVSHGRGLRYSHVSTKILYSHLGALHCRLKDLFLFACFCWSVCFVILLFFYILSLWQIKLSKTYTFRQVLVNVESSLWNGMTALTFTHLFINISNPTIHIHTFSHDTMFNELHHKASSRSVVIQGY